MSMKAIAILPERCHGPEDGSQRRLKVVRQRGKEGRAQPLGLGGQSRLVDLDCEPDAFEGDRRLVHKRVEEPPFIGRQQHFGPSPPSQPDDTDGASAGAKRNK
jgi:hypothetical protein